MKSYSQVVEEFENKPFSDEDYIFDYRDTPLEEEFNDIFQFYQETLRLNEHYGISPNRIYFNTDYSVNARAAKTSDFYVISINMGTITELMKIFKNNTKFKESINGEMSLVEGLFDVSIQDLMYQVAIHYTFYHEMAHLIQNSELLQMGLYEYSENSVEFSAARHSLELDADEYSAISIAAHTVQYARNMFGDNISSDKVERLLVLVCGAILLYILSFPTNKKDIYYKESSHPHPVIRITRIIITIIDHYLQTLEQLKINIEIDMSAVVINTIAFAEKIEFSITGKNPMEKYVSYLENQKDAITAYVKEFDELNINNNSLAVSKWNVHARKLHGS